MELSWLFITQLLAVSYLKLIDIVLIYPQSHDLSQRHNLIDCRLHRYSLKSIKITFDNAFRPKLLPSRSEGSLDEPFLRIFDHLETSNDVEVLFPKLSESKTVPSMVL
ncbi:hypothetical protein AVEN_163345-1 [Araneus ventricosus]|uniref:Uncharacterized protein n=1 Tax=Araneus ventricosus TaxID=182803 RepID=A0A4Y2A210_ARAVE|nr:hypothetical protein AVEN_163345-1 [Araneus ventricosus]